MAFDVFISYASKDKIVADAVCAKLESSAIRCWIAPRDIVAGTSYGEAIIEAIHGAKVMVLVFSSNANASGHIPKEVERAVSNGVAILPFRIEDVAPGSRSIRSRSSSSLERMLALCCRRYSLVQTGPRRSVLPSALWPSHGVATSLSDATTSCSTSRRGSDRRLLSMVQQRAGCHPRRRHHGRRSVHGALAGGHGEARVHVHVAYDD